MVRDGNAFRYTPGTHRPDREVPAWVRNGGEGVAVRRVKQVGGRFSCNRQPTHDTPPHMRCLRHSVWFAAGVTLLITPPGFAQPTDAELKCELLVNKAGAIFAGSKTKCIDRCFKAFWAGLGPSTDCIPPTYGGATALCIGNAASGLKGAENKLANAIRKACDSATKVNAECPACYGSGDCSTSGFATDHVEHLQGQIDSLVFGVMCELDANADEQRCQLTTSKLIAKHMAGATKCYAKCRSNARTGLITPESCNPPAADPTTAACLQRIFARTTATIDAACRGAGAIPDCSFTDDYPNGETWATLVNIAVDGNQQLVFCN
jgi:hypothetical protein